MLEEIIITPAILNDIPLIKPLIQELIETVENTEGFNVEKSVENLRVLINDPSGHILIAREKDQILGFVNFTTRTTITHPGPSGLIDELVISRDRRSSGIGKLLILAVIDKCRELGCCEVEVSTEKSNTHARKFYKACGFEEGAVLLELDIDA